MTDDERSGHGAGGRHAAGRTPAETADGSGALPPLEGDPAQATPPRGLPVPDPVTDTGRHALIEPDDAAPPLPDPAGEAERPGLAPGAPAPAPADGADDEGEAPARTWSGRLRRYAPLAAAAVVLALLAGLAGGWIGWTLAGRSVSDGALGRPLPQADPASSQLTPVEAVAEKVLPSVVLLKVEGGGPGEDEGSGIVLSADGLVLTNDHVVSAAAAGGTITALLQDGRAFPARIVGRDTGSDLALVRLDGAGGLTAAELGNSDSLRVGQQVVAIGAPLGLDGTVTTGIVSALDRAVSVGGDQGGQATVLNAVQHDAPINPGNSGGPLVDLQGRVVGVNSAIASTGGNQGGSIGVGFSIPVNQARRVADELNRTGRATRAVLGVTVTAVGQPANGGAVVGQVTPGGPAALAGLHPGDVVLRVGDRPIADGDELVAAIRDHQPGEQVGLALTDRQVTVTLAGEPS
ncbi:trypsin-like peptidase domain-containing protein [Pseudonocardia kujensis]|uniref:S1C family serine protease n=1 Tax=Pseudonocardia kujensis TaxID=1128675 RepID=UPI001E581D52|nr:trypsin-like peptidase domain-containing protein [Pseudonocardia kujensis]MCE0763215.1 trypsin-like peptidase domain-containing protein [Pseudonocardia kujensis]